MFTQCHCLALALLVGLGRQTGWQLIQSVPFAGFYSRLRRDEALGSHERIPGLPTRQTGILCSMRLFWLVWTRPVFPNSLPRFKHGSQWAPCPV